MISKKVQIILAVSFLTPFIVYGAINVYRHEHVMACIRYDQPKRHMIEMHYWYRYKQCMLAGNNELCFEQLDKLREKEMNALELDDKEQGCL